MPELNIARGTTSPEFSTIRAVRNAREVLRSGVTSLSIPGGTWFVQFKDQLSSIPDDDEADVIRELSI